MGVTIEVRYEGDLHCTAIHAPSGDRLPTDAPVDNEGRGEHFSPTDLVATALGTCVLTVMGIAAKRNGWEMRGAHATVTKEMGASPRRHIRRIECRIALPAALDARARATLEATARACPVTASMGPLTEVDVTFDYRL